MSTLLLTAEAAIPDSPPSRSVEASSSDAPIYLSIARDFAWLAEQRQLRLEPMAMRQGYVAAFIPRGLASYHGTPFIEPIISALNEHFPSALLKLKRRWPCSPDWIAGPFKINFPLLTKMVKQRGL